MQPTMEVLYRDVEEIKKEVHEIREILFSEPELREDVVDRLEQARKEIKTNFITHEEMMKEFAGHDLRSAVASKDKRVPS